MHAYLFIMYNEKEASVILLEPYIIRKIGTRVLEKTMVRTPRCLYNRKIKSFLESDKNTIFGLLNNNYHDEELAEYHNDQNIEELADLLEVIYAATKAKLDPN